MKVAIWGSYNYGNYSDDLMAIQFAKELEKLGTEPVVYRLDRQLAQQYSVNNADFAVWPASAKNIRLTTFLAKADNIRNAKAKFDFATIDQHKQLSWGHIDRLKELVNHHNKT